MKKLSFVFYSLFFMIAGHGQKADALIAEANKLVLDEKYDSALLVLDKAWNLDSNAYHVHTLRGMIYYQTEKWKESFQSFSIAIHKHPDSVYAYHRRANLLARLMYTEDAIIDNTRALERAEDDSLRLFLFSNRALNYVMKRDFQNAYEDNYKAWLIDTSNMDVINNMATILDELGRVDEAIAMLKKLVHLDSNYIAAYVNLGFQHSKLGKHKEAIDYLNKALTIQPDEPLTLNNRGSARYHLKDYKGALEDINQSLSFYPTNSYAFRNRALVYIALKEMDKACEDIKKALEQGFTEMYGPEMQTLQKQHCAGK